jgi:hypothetical protein
MHRAIFVLAVFAMATAAPLAQRGKNKPPAPEPITGTAVIRCADESDPLPDVICADGRGAYVHGDPGVTAWLGENGNLLLRVSADPALARAHVVRIPDFDDWDFQDCDPACVAPIPDGGLVVYTEPRDGEHAYVAAGNNLAGGLAGMTDGQTSSITMLIGFPDPDPASDIRWSLYWNPEYYAETDWATASRIGCTWTITAADEALAGFWLFRVRQGKVRDTQEGRFKAPVQITFTAEPGTVPGC